MMFILQISGGKYSDNLTSHSFFLASPHQHDLSHSTIRIPAGNGLQY